jgi:hypothetical protein
MLIRKIDKDDDYDKFNQRRIFKKGSELFGEPTRMEVLGGTSGTDRLLRSMVRTL